MNTMTCNNEEMQDIFEALNMLDPNQFLSFRELLFPGDNTVSHDKFIDSIKDRFLKKKSGCPHCNRSNYIKKGKNKQNNQCYLCKNCGKIFSDRTNSPISYTKKTVQQWIKYMDCMTKQLTLRESAKIVGIHRNTSLQWRHKILYVLKCRLSDNLTGIIEMNEIKVAENFKGNHSKKPFYFAKRPPRCRGLRPHELLAEKKVCVLCCRDRIANRLIEVSGYIRSSASILYKLLKPRISNVSAICTNNNSSYIGFANILKLKLYKMIYNNEVKNKIYHINNAKNFSEDFLCFLLKFRGVATKYLNFYAIWFKWMDSTKKHFHSYRKLGLFLIFTSSDSKIRVCDLKNVKSIPSVT